MQTQKRLQYRVGTELPSRHKKVYGAEEQGISFTISPSLRLSTPVFFTSFDFSTSRLNLLFECFFQRGQNAFVHAEKSQIVGVASVDGAGVAHIAAE